MANPCCKPWNVSQMVEEKYEFEFAKYSKQNCKKNTYEIWIPFLTKDTRCTWSWWFFCTLVQH